MLDELLKFDRLGTKEELLFLLFNALPLSQNQKMLDIKKYCISNHFSIGKSFDGAIKLLSFLKIVNFSDGIISLNNELFNLANVKDKSLYFEQSDFIKYLFLSLKNEVPISNFIKPEALKRNIEDGRYYVKENLIPFEFFSIRNLLISLGFFERHTILGVNHLFINHNFTRFLETQITIWIAQESEKQSKKFLLSDLKTRISNQEKAGKEAEIFVLSFEQKRLQGHMSINKIKRVSDDFTNAGYDIESFSDKNAVFLDRFIEVKSYINSIGFYWSQNEVLTAKELSDNYFLYLVDRDKMSVPDYFPKIFQNPYKQIFENSLWKKETETWKFSLSKND